MGVKVRFPNGIKEVPAFIGINPLAERRDRMTSLEPEPIEGWQFERILGDPEWIAFKVSK